MFKNREQIDDSVFSFGFITGYLKKYDYVQIVAATMLLALGVMFIYSTGNQVGSKLALTFWVKQLQWICCGLGVWAIMAAGDYRQFKPVSIIIYLFCLALLVIVLLYGTKIYGARRWLFISELNIRLQPSEFSKLGVILLLSALFSSRTFNVNKFKYLVSAGVIVGVPFLLIAKEPDLGSALVLLPLSVIMIFAAGLHWKYILISLILICSLATGEIINETTQFYPLLKEYQKERILTFLDPERDITYRGYNQFQAKLAVGSGGMTGKGIGQGTQNTLGFLPQSVSNNDFIFSVIAEETGFVGCVALILAYIVLLYSMLRTAFVASDTFGRYIAIGIATVFFTHCFINIGMSIGATPVTGLPLPFVSYGGSFILFAMCSLGILQSIYRLRKD